VIDIVIISLAVVASGVFLGLQWLLLRFFTAYRRVTLLFQIAIAVALINGGFLGSLYVLGLIKLVTFVCILFCSELIYLQVVILFILTCFSNVESSITVKLFSLIVQEGREGITRGKLRQQYDRRKIVERRLDRFVDMKDIEKRKGLYIKKQRVGAFYVREYILHILRLLFPT
jgi:hypothetical protein